MSIDFGINKIRQPNGLERQMLGDIRATILLPEVMPYFGRMSMRFRYGIAEDFGTMSITRKGLIIIDPVVMAEWGVPKSAGHVAHLWLHWLFDHARRAMELDVSEFNFYASIWNVAADCHCTESLHNIYLAKHMVHLETHQSLGVPRQTHVEATYHALLDKFIENKVKGEGGDMSLPDDLKVEDFFNDTNGNNYLQNRGQEALDARKDHLDNLDVDAEFAELLAQEAKNASEIDDIPQELFNQGIDPFRATHHYCGSGAGHIPLDFEAALEAAMGEFGQPGMSDIEAQALRDGVASDIADHFKHRGNAPAGLERFVKEQLRPPQVPWQARLRVTVQRPLLNRAGLQDFTFNKRRKNQPNSGGIILPSMAGGEPGQCGVAIDTSGSMTEHDLAMALSELGGILKHYDVVGYAVDSECHEIGDVFKVNQFSLKGGGGTDMRMAVYMAAERRPKITSLVIITDGDTPWPDQRPETNLSMQVVAAIVTPQEEGSGVFQYIPSWIDRVRIPTSGY